MFHPRFALIALCFIFIPIPGVALRLPRATICKAFSLVADSSARAERQWYHEPSRGLTTVMGFPEVFFTTTSK